MHDQVSEGMWTWRQENNRVTMQGGARVSLEESVSKFPILKELFPFQLSTKE